MGLKIWQQEYPLHNHNPFLATMHKNLCTQESLHLCYLLLVISLSILSLLPSTSPNLLYEARLIEQNYGLSVLSVAAWKIRQSNSLSPRKIQKD